jgi:steroid delta-isomerase-like uncharacterized protein
MFELRAAMSLVRLQQENRQSTAARQVLAEIYDGFSEGFNTSDLQEAKDLLTLEFSVSLAENKAIVLRCIEMVQNQHNLAAIDELYGPDFVDHSSNADLQGIEGTKVFFNMMFAAFPDMHFSIRMQLAEGDQVMTYKTFHGTHQGHFMGIPPTCKQVVVDVIDILTIKDGKIAEHWTVSDMLGMLQQLGVIPAPGT